MSQLRLIARSKNRPDNEEANNWFADARNKDYAQDIGLNPSKYKGRARKEGKGKAAGGSLEGGTGETESEEEEKANAIKYYGP